MTRAENKIPDSLTAEDVIAAAAELDGNIDHPFHESTKFDVLIENRRYPPKAILGVASKLGANIDLVPADFSGNSLCVRANIELDPLISDGMADVLESFP